MRKETRREEIIQTAAKLFKEKGYSAVTMRDLATALNIKAASLYNHINSKQEILKEIIISLAEDFTNGMERIKSSNYSSIEKLNEIIVLHISITSKNTFGMASLNNDWMHLEEQLQYYLELRSNYENDFKNILIDGVNKNEIVDSDIETMLFSLLSTLRSLYLWIPKKEDLDFERISKNLSTILINGINK